VLQLAAPHRRPRVWTRTIPSPEVARLAGDFNLTRILPSDKFVHHFERGQTPCLRLAIRKRRGLRETAAGCPLI